MKKMPKKPSLKIEERAIGTIRPYKRNPKNHSPAQIKAIAKSILAFGFISPVLINNEGDIIAGHGRYAAAMELGLASIPTVVVSHLDEEQQRTLRIADNRLAEKGSSWSIELLQSEIADLALDTDFDVSATGFDVLELDAMFDAVTSKNAVIEPEVPAVETIAGTRIDDLWEIGPHKLICGDATVPTTFRKLLGRRRPVMIFADTPYNVKIAGNVKTAKHSREFIQASGEMTDEEFRAFLLAYMMNCATFSVPGSLHYHCIDWRSIHKLLAGGLIAYDEYINLCVWAKPNAGLGSLYRSQHELVAVFRKGGSHRNNVQLGKNGRHRSNLWAYPSMSSFSADRAETLAAHPTPKSVAMVRDAIMDSTGRGELVLDPFGGSGTTLLAAHEAGRVAALIELDLLYCDVILRRTEAALGTSAVLSGTGETFEQVLARRSAADE